jgi:hypothetical protein
MTEVLVVEVPQALLQPMEKLDQSELVGAMKVGAPMLFHNGSEVRMSTPHVEELEIPLTQVGASTYPAKRSNGGFVVREVPKLQEVSMDGVLSGGPVRVS